MKPHICFRATGFALSKNCFPQIMLLLVIFTTAVLAVNGQAPDGSYPLNFSEPCSSEIYCQGPLLFTVQLCEIYNESKSFVDTTMLQSPNATLQEFFARNLTQNDCDAVRNFVIDHFSNDTTLYMVNATFPDWNEPPAFLQLINDTKLKEWGAELHRIWNELGRQILPEIDNSDRTSMIYSPNPFVIPGGRFREFYYWDSYWIQIGLLVSDMTETVKGMISNFIDFIDNPTLRYVPNGGRIYYERSQPPLLIPMVENYYKKTGDSAFVQSILPKLEDEFDFWVKSRSFQFDFNGGIRTMYRYSVDVKGPRPEQVAKEYPLVKGLNTSEENEALIYSHIKSACESGWDFSTRWYSPDTEGANGTNITSTEARYIIPVDLNAFMYKNAIILADLCTQFPSSCIKGTSYYNIKAILLKSNIHEVLWDDEEGFWFDYNFIRRSHRKDFYASNIAPLWMNATYEPISVAGQKALNYLIENGVLSYPGGIPTSLIYSGEQWDLPNVWPPLLHMVVESLENIGSEQSKLKAFEVAQNWTYSNYLGWAVGEGEGNRGMFEKYDARNPGCKGLGGLYETVLGFGWTNGVILDFMEKYGDKLQSPAEIPPVLDCPKGEYHSEFY